MNSQLKNFVVSHEIGAATEQDAIVAVKLLMTYDIASLEGMELAIASDVLSGASELLRERLGF